MIAIPIDTDSRPGDIILYYVCSYFLQDKMKKDDVNKSCL